MKPAVAVFSKDNPANKADLWRCFKRSATGFATVQVDDAHSIIGKNAPRYLERAGYLVRDTTEKGDFYYLTVLGEQWLIRGIRSYVKNHPAEREGIAFFPDDAPAARRVRRRAE